MRRARARAGLPVRTEARDPAAGRGAVAGPGRPAAGRVVPARPGRATSSGRVLEAAERAHQPVRLGLAVPPELAGLPWEALPGPDGRGPLALHPLVSLYRKAEAAAGRVLPGPLRIVVAIAAPDIRRRAGAGLRAGTAQRARRGPRRPRRTPPTCGWCRSPPRRRSAPSWTAARRTCCTSPGTAPPACWTWKTRTGRRGRSPPRSSSTRRSRRGGCRR